MFIEAFRWHYAPEPKQSCILVTEGCAMLIATSRIPLTALMASSLLDATMTPFPAAKPLALTTNAGKSALQQN